MPLKEGDHVVCIAEGPKLRPAKRGWQGIVLKLSSGALFVAWVGGPTDRVAGITTPIDASNAYLLQKIDS